MSETTALKTRIAEANVSDTNMPSKTQPIVEIEMDSGTLQKKRSTSERARKPKRFVLHAPT